MSTKAPTILTIGQQDMTSWPIKRRMELSLLCELLNTASSLNRGSNFIGNVQRCTVIAEQLTRADLENSRPSFYQFLVNEANSTKSDNGTKATQDPSLPDGA